MKCEMCGNECDALINNMMCEVCYSQACMDDDGGPVRTDTHEKHRPTKGDKKAKRRYNKYRKGGGKGRRITKP